MIALVVVSTFVVLVLGILVAGLLRSHADILRSLHELGVGVGDPLTDAGAVNASTTGGDRLGRPATLPPHRGAEPAARPRPTVAGVTPTGDARAISVTNSDGLTLSPSSRRAAPPAPASGTRCSNPAGSTYPTATRAVIVTKGPDREVPCEVQARTTGHIPVVMSTEAWVDYQVPGSPFFVLVDGATGTKVGQGVASHVGQLAELVRRAEHDRGGDGAVRDRGAIAPGAGDRNWARTARRARPRPTTSCAPPASTRATRACIPAPSKTSFPTAPRHHPRRPSRVRAAGAGLIGGHHRRPRHLGPPARRLRGTHLRPAGAVSA